MDLDSLERLRVIMGDDMRPSINPDEALLLDKGARPEVGDVVLFENRHGMKIAHRLLFSFGGYCFTKGDNCPFINFPFKREKLMGVVVGKKREVRGEPVAQVLLAAFLPQFVLHSMLFGLKGKRYFLLLSLASGYYPKVEAGPRS